MDAHSSNCLDCKNSARCIDFIYDMIDDNEYFDTSGVIRVGVTRGGD